MSIRPWRPNSIASLLAMMLIGRLPLVLAATSPPGVTLVSCDSRQALVEVDLPLFQTLTVRDHGIDYQKLSVAGWSQLLLAGKPILPQIGILLAMPPGAIPEIRVEVLQSHVLPLENPLPAPTLITALEGTDVREEYRKDESLYRSPALYPGSWARLGEPFWLRTFWCVPVVISPFQAQCGLKQMQVADKLRLTITFRGEQAGRYISDPHAQAWVQQNVLNFTAARNWQARPSQKVDLPDQVDAHYKVYVGHDGLHCITYDDLLAAEIDPATINPQTFKLYRIVNVAVGTLEEVPLWVEGENDGVFNANDYILFFGLFARGTFTYEYRYARDNVYWLGWGGNPGLRLPETTVTPTSATPAQSYTAHTRTEIDTLYYKFGLADSGDNIDHWMWYHVDALFTPQLSYLINLPGHLRNNDYTLTVSVRGYTTDQMAYPQQDTTGPDHQVTVRWNNTTLIQNALFDGQDDTVLTVAVDTNAIFPTNPNEIIVEAPVMFDFYNSFFLDWIKVDYSRSYTVVNDSLLFSHPTNMAAGQFIYQLGGFQESEADSIELWNLSREERLVDFEYIPGASGVLRFQDLSDDSTHYFVSARHSWWSPDSIVYDTASAWADTNHRVDYLMITHEKFYNDLDDLVSLYENANPPMQVERVKIGDLYDEFSLGLKDPSAIYRFLQYAYFTYQEPAPSYVLLVGDASWDYKNYDPLPFQDYLPTHAFWSYKWGETASDNWFVNVLPYQNVVPEMIISRYPVNTPAETQILVQKSLTYTQNPPPGYWRSQIILTNGALVDTGDAPGFDLTAQGLVDQYFPSWYDPPRVYSTPSPGNEQYYGTSQDLIGYINRGAITLNYEGHAGNQMWGTLNQSQISQLANGAKLPFVQAYSCFTGIFSNTNGFGEAMILEPDGGGIVYLSNGAVGYTDTNAWFNNKVFLMLFAPPNPYVFPLTLGQAMTAAKVDYYYNLFPPVSYDYGDVIQTFVMMGDPGPKFLYVEPSPADTLDNLPPEIQIFAGAQGYNFHNGDYLSNPVQFRFEVFDSTLVDYSTLTLEAAHLTNAVGNPLSDSIWVWNWNPPDTVPHPYPLSQFDSLVLYDSQHFTAAFADSLSGGEWQFKITIADYYLQASTDSIIFNVGAERLTFDGVPLPYPNPFREETSFTFSLSQPAEVTIKIYTVSGKLIRTLHTLAAAGFNLLPWDGRDQEGDPLSNGAYLYKIIAHNGNQQIERVEKLAKLR